MAGRAIGHSIGWRFGLIMAAEFVGLAVIARVLALPGFGAALTPDVTAVLLARSA